MCRVVAVVVVIAAVVSLNDACIYQLDRDRGLSPGEVQGKLTRSDDGDTPAEFSRISVPGSTRIARALKNGTYRLQGLPPGNIAFKFEDDVDGDGRAERGGFAGARLPVDDTGKVGFVLLGAIGITGTMNVTGNVSVTVVDPVTGDSANVSPFELGLVARVFATRGECFDFGDDDAATAAVVATPTECPPATADRLETGAEAVAAADDAGNYEIDGVLAGHVELSVVLTQADPNGGVGAVVDVHGPVNADGKAGDVVAADPFVLPQVGPVGKRIVTIAPNPPVDDGTVVLRAAGAAAQPNTGGALAVPVRCEDGLDGLPADALVFPHVLHDQGEAALVVDFGVYDVTVCGADGLSGTTPSQLALPPIGDTDVPRWIVLRFPGDPCVHRRGDRPVVDCDDDNLEAIPPLDPNGGNVDLYAACQSACWDGDPAHLAQNSAENTCEFAGATFDCDDDGDGQPDPTEPNACQGAGNGADFDGDFHCTFGDPSPTCTSNDPAACEAGTFDVAPADPTEPPLVLPGVWTPGPDLPAGRTAVDVVATPFIESSETSHGIIGAALLNTRDAAGVLQSDGVAFRFSTGAFELLDNLDPNAVPFTNSATAFIEPFGAEGAVGGRDGSGNVLSTARLVDAFESDSFSGISTSRADIPAPVADGALAVFLGFDPSGSPGTLRFVLGGGVDGADNVVDTIFVVDQQFVTTNGDGLLVQLTLAHARKNARAVAVDFPSRALFIGGDDDAGGIVGPIDVVTLDDPSQPVVAATAPSLATPRTHFSATASFSTIVVVGGRDAAGNVLSSVERLTFDGNGDVVGGAGAAMSAAREDHAATLVDSDTILVTGGFDAGGNAVAATEAYSISLDRWTSLAPEPHPRGLHQAIPLSSSSLLVVGGRATVGGDDLGTTEVLSLGGGGEGEGEGASGEGEGEGGDPPCATVAPAVVPQLFGNMTDAAFDAIGGHLYFADDAQGIVAADVVNGAFGGTGFAVFPNPSDRDITIANGFVVATGGIATTSGEVDVIDAVNVAIADSFNINDPEIANIISSDTFSSGPYFAVAGVALGADDYVIFEGQTHALFEIVRGDGVSTVPAFALTFDHPHQEMELFDNGLARRILLIDREPGGTNFVESEELPLNGGINNNVSTSFIGFLGGVGFAPDQSLLMAQTFTEFGFAGEIAGTSVTTFAPGPSTFLSQGLEPLGLAVVGGTRLVVGALDTGTSSFGIQVFTGSFDAPLTKAGGLTPLAAGPVDKIVDLGDGVHAYVMNGGIVDVSACPGGGT